MSPDDPHLRILQAIDYLPLNMVTIPSLGRTVTSRERFARIFALGDRSNPSAYTPSIVLMDDDDSMEVADAPFRMFRDSSKAPAELKMKTRANLCPPFEDQVSWKASEGLSLPPSLIESDAGIFPHGSAFLPITTQSLFHDPMLANLEVEPSIICFVDSIQPVSYTHLTLPTISDV